MFTGIVESTSKVLEYKKEGSELFLTLECPVGWEVVVGQSISVDGVCLTVTSSSDDLFTVTLIGETLSKTVFGTSVPDQVNLERAMLPSDRFDGHMVQGHIDTVGTAEQILQDGLSRELTFAVDASYDGLIIQKGSVAINGVSLTVSKYGKGYLSVVLIPHTLEVTTLSMLTKGDFVNVEFDIVGKYLQKYNQENNID